MGGFKYLFSLHHKPSPSASLYRYKSQPDLDAVQDDAMRWFVDIANQCFDDGQPPETITAYLDRTTLIIYEVINGDYVARCSAVASLEDEWSWEFYH